MSTSSTTYDDPAAGRDAIPHADARALLGQVMGYVAVTVGFAALGACLGRVIADYADADPSALWRAAGATAAFVAALGAYGLREDEEISGWRRPAAHLVLAEGDPVADRGHVLRRPSAGR